MKQFGGPAAFIDRNDINTDEIIPAKYLTEITKKALAPHLLEDLHLEGQQFDPHSAVMQAAQVLIMTGAVLLGGQVVSMKPTLTIASAFVRVAKFMASK